MALQPRHRETQIRRNGELAAGGGLRPYLMKHPHIIKSQNRMGMDLKAFKDQVRRCKKYRTEFLATAALIGGSVSLIRGGHCVPLFGLVEMATVRSEVTITLLPRPLSIVVLRLFVSIVMVGALVTYSAHPSYTRSHHTRCSTTTDE